MPKIRILLLVMLGSAALYSQVTQLDLRMQSRDVDFSGSSATKPFKSGTGLPSSCGQGEMYYRMDAAAGMNVYGCTTSNSWTLEQGPPAASMASQLGDFAVTAASSPFGSTTTSEEPDICKRFGIKTAVLLPLPFGAKTRTC